MAGLGTVAARLAVMLAAVGPPVAVAGVWRDVVMNHPVLTVVLLGMYEVLVAVLVFAGKIATELRQRWEERIVSRLDRALGQRLSRFDKRYREFMLGSLRFIDLKGLATVGFYTPELDGLLPWTPQPPYGSRRSAWPPKPTRATRSSLATRSARSQPE